MCFKADFRQLQLARPGRPPCWGCAAMQRACRLKARAAPKERYQRYSRLKIGSKGELPRSRLSRLVEEKQGQEENWDEAEDAMPKLQDRKLDEGYGHASSGRKGIGSYAAKREEGRQLGLSFDEINQLHPERIRQLKEEKLAAYKAAQDVAPKIPQQKSRRSKSEPRSWVDEEELEEPVEENEWNLAEHMKETLDNPDLASEIRDIPETRKVDAKRGAAGQKPLGGQEDGIKSKGPGGGGASLDSLNQKRKNSLSRGFKSILAGDVGATASDKAQTKGGTFNQEPDKPQGWLRDVSSEQTEAGLKEGDWDWADWGQPDDSKGRGSNQEGAPDTKRSPRERKSMTNKGQSTSQQDAERRVSSLGTSTSAHPGFSEPRPREMQKFGSDRQPETDMLDAGMLGTQMTPEQALKLMQRKKSPAKLPSKAPRVAEERASPVRQSLTASKDVKLRRDPGSPELQDKEDIDWSEILDDNSEDLREESEEEETLAKRIPVKKRQPPKAAPVKKASTLTEGQEFYRAADILQARLMQAVSGEQQSARDSYDRVYKRRTIRQLRASGMTLTDMHATWDAKASQRSASEQIWTLHLAKDADTEGFIFNTGPDSAMSSINVEDDGEGSKLQQKARGADAEASEAYLELPVHTFKKGDPIIFRTARSDGTVPKFEVDLDPLQGSVISLRRRLLKVAVTTDVHKELLQAPAGKRWRIDKTIQDTTTSRQLQALSGLDLPFDQLWMRDACRDFDELLKKTQQSESSNMGEEEFDAMMDGEARVRAFKEARAEHRSQGTLAPDFRIGELQMRKILLGSPIAAKISKTPPTWVSGSQTWRQEVRKHLQDVCLSNKEARLNDSQVKAIALSLCQTCTLWQGPPGTGKTRTLLALLQILSRMVRVDTGGEREVGAILACADTNAATDNILQGLAEKGVNVVRLGRPSSVREELVNHTLEFKAYKHPDGVRAKALLQESEDAWIEYGSEAVAQLKKAKKKDDYEMRRERLSRKAQRCERDANALIDQAKQAVLAEADVVTATCAGAGDQKVLGYKRFRIVVIDEASQSTEPSSLIPLLRGAECVIMAGDPQQLPPTVVSDAGMKAGLDITLFERLMDSGLDPWLLDTQYRMHPSIAQLPNMLFYEGRINTGIPASDRPVPKGFPWPNPECPVALVECDHGEEVRGDINHKQAIAADGSLLPGATSICNLVEASLAIRCLEMLLATGDVENGAILTPYNAQASLIRRLIKSSGIKEKIVVSSVDGYQGREADVIVFSCVRNNPEGKLGFVTDERRLNVAITRPRRGLVVLGAPDTLSSDGRWLKWMSWVRDNGGLLAAEALLLTADEKASGKFDPDVNAAALLLSRSNKTRKQRQRRA